MTDTASSGCSADQLLMQTGPDGIPETLSQDWEGWFNPRLSSSLSNWDKLKVWNESTDSSKIDYRLKQRSKNNQKQSLKLQLNNRWEQTNWKEVQITKKENYKVDKDRTKQRKRGEKMATTNYKTRTNKRKNKLQEQNKNEDKNK